MASDLRFAARLLFKDRGFAAAATLVLALGIGVNNMLFTILNAHTIRGLPLAQPDRVLSISAIDNRGAERGFSYRELGALRQNIRTADVAAFSTATVVLGRDGHAPERYDAAYVSGHAFSVLRIQPLIGREFTDSDERSRAPIALLADAVWQSLYSRDPGVLGQTILINGTPTIIVGVISDRSGFPATSKLWLPLSQPSEPDAEKGDARTLRVVARVHDDVSVTDARAEIDSVFAGIATTLAETSRDVRARVVTINERYLGRLTDPVWLAFMAVGFLVLFISCANVANLLLARAIRRGREIAIRVSLGARRRRVMRQLLVECALLASIGAATGLAVATGGIGLFRSAIPAGILPYWVDYSLDARVLGALVAVAAGSVLIFGLAPAAYAIRSDVNSVLRAGAQAGPNRSARRWTTGFLSAQFGLTVVLLSYVVFDLRRAEPKLPTDALVESADLITASLTLPAGKYPSPESRADFYQRLERRVIEATGIRRMALASAAPYRGALERRVEIETREIPDAGQLPTVWSIAASPGYFDTLGVGIERGRSFAPLDGSSGRESAIVNHRFAELFFAAEDPLGRRIRLRTPDSQTVAPWLTVVGVSPTLRQRSGAAPDPIVYVPLQSAAPGTITLLLPAQPNSLVAQVRHELGMMDPDLPLDRVMSLEAAIHESRWNGRVSSGLIRALTLIALALALVGLYAAVAHAVALQTREIGVRVAIGARPAHIGRWVLRTALKQVAIGLLVGILCTLAWDRAFFSGRPGSRLSLPEVIAPVSLVLGLIAFAAAVLPIRRALHVDPATVLRHE